MDADRPGWRRIHNHVAGCHPSLAPRSRVHARDHTYYTGLPSVSVWLACGQRVASAVDVSLRCGNRRWQSTVESVTARSGAPAWQPAEVLLLPPPYGARASLSLRLHPPASASESCSVPLPCGWVRHRLDRLALVETECVWHSDLVAMSDVFIRAMRHATPAIEQRQLRYREKADGDSGQHLWGRRGRVLTGRRPEDGREAAARL